MPAMNRRRDQPRTSASVVGAWICCLVLCVYGGTQFVRLKNRQTQTQRQIERVRLDIDKLHFEIEETKRGSASCSITRA